MFTLPLTYDCRMKISYNINEKERIIICIIVCENQVENRLSKYGVISNRYNGDVSTDFRKYIGKAKCSPNDRWNEEFGKMLAKNRALIKRAKDINNSIQEVITDWNNKLQILNMYGKISEPHSLSEEEIFNIINNNNLNTKDNNIINNNNLNTEDNNINNLNVVNNDDDNFNDSVDNGTDEENLTNPVVEIEPNFEVEQTEQNNCYIENMYP